MAMLDLPGMGSLKMPTAPAQPAAPKVPFGGGGPADLVLANGPAPKPAAIDDTSPEAFTADFNYASEVAKVYDELRAQISTSAGQARADLMKAANTARSQVDMIYAKWMPQMQKYSKELTGDFATGNGRQSAQGRLGAIQSAGMEQTQYNQDLGMREIDLAEKSQLAEMDAQAEFANLDALQQMAKDAASGGDHADSQFWVQGRISELKANGATDGEIRNTIINELIGFGVDPTEALGKFDSAWREDPASGRQLAFEAAEAVVQRNMPRYIDQGGPTQENTNDFVARVSESLHRAGYSSLGDAGLTRDELVQWYIHSVADLMNSHVQQAQQQGGGGDGDFIPDDWQAPNSRTAPRRLWDWVNPFG